MSQLLSAGLNITLVGMLVVFSLLGVLIGVVRAMSALAGLLQPVEPAPAVHRGRADPIPDNDELIVVMSAAIRRYRRDRAARGGV